MRYELKYFASKEELEHCYAVIQQHPASFRKEFPDRVINNIYLDTSDLQSYQEASAGISSRLKYRIRWYGEWHLVKSPVLELKIKSNQLGTKQRHKIDPFALTNFKSVLETLKEKKIIPLHLWAISSNSYKRSYFRSFCGKFRITVDRDLKFSSINGRVVQPRRTSENVILELKYPLLAEDEADWIRQFIPFRRTKFSKYTEALLL